MEAKHFTFLALCALLFVVGVIAVRRRPSLRDWLFGLGVYITTDLGRYDVNLFGRTFYRAATRGIELSVLDVVASILLVTTPASQRWGRPATYGLIVAYALYAAFSVVTNDPMLFGTYELTKILRGLLVFTAAARYVTGPRQLKVLMLGLTAAMLYEGYAALTSRYLHGVHRVFGTLDHANNLAVFSNVAAPILLTGALADYPVKLRRIFAATYALCGVCVVLTISRTGFAVLLLTSTAVVLSLVRIRLTRRQVAAGLAALLLGAGAVYRAKDSLLERYSSATLEEEATSDKGRGLYFRLGAAVFAERPLGVGLNNWSYVITNEFYPKLRLPFRPYENTDCDFSDYTAMEAEHMVAPPAHNLWILTLGEVGIIGFGLFVAIWWRWMRIAQRFVRKAATDPQSRYAAGVFYAMFGLTLSTMTEYAYRHAQIFFFVHLLVGGMMGVILGRQRLLALERARERAERQAAQRSARPAPRRASIPAL